MKTVKKLPPELISKIAAGEVIERPAYAVKELIENSLDAKANNIKITIVNGGLDKIIITDNGTGMSKQDLEIAILPHTTSKIYTESELIGIKSLGFRGEALSSLASVSQLTIYSKSTNKKLGTKIVVNNSQVKSINPAGIPQGTQIVVDKLFSSVPVRKKFLKTTQTEYRHILEIIVSNTLANHKVGFNFISNGKQVLKIDRKDKLISRITNIFGEQVSNNLIPIQFSESYINISGYLGRPQISNSNSNKIYLFINKRRVFDPAIISVIREAYDNLLERHTYPTAFLFLSVPYDLVDVNVHPRKEIVKFINPSTIYESFSKAVSETLRNNNLTFYNIPWKSSTHSAVAKTLREEVNKLEIANLGKIKKTGAVIQIHNLYLITETKMGMMFIDQHAAHEAILYRKFKENFLKQKDKAITLKKSVLLNFSLSEYELIKEYFDVLNKLGFDLEEFGEKAIKVNSVPQVLKELNIKQILLEIISDLSEHGSIKNVDKQTNKMLAYLACRSAIKGGQKLTKVEIKKLINQLQKEDYLYTCPHGRPVKVEVNLNDFARLFYRK